MTEGPQVENVVLGLSKGSEDYDGILKIADDFFELTKDTTYETLKRCNKSNTRLSTNLLFGLSIKLKAVGLMETRKRKCDCR